MIQRLLSSDNRWLAYLLLTLTAFFWGSNAIVARGFNADIPAVTLAFWRWSLATALVLPFTWKYFVRDWRPMLRAWPVMLALSFLGITVFNTVLYYAAHTTSAINIGLVQTTMPVMIIILCFTIYHEGITPAQGLGVMLALSGGIVTITRGDLDVLLNMSFVPGDLWMLLAMVAYSLYSVLLRERPKIHPMSFLGCTFLVGTVVLLPVYLWERVIVDAPVIISTKLIASVIYIGIFPSILAYLFWNYGVAKIGATRAGLFITLIPVFATALSLILLDDPFETFHAFGLAFILCGIVMANLKKAQA